MLIGDTAITLPNTITRSVRRTASFNADVFTETIPFGCVVADSPNSWSPPPKQAIPEIGPDKFHPHDGTALLP